MKRDSNVNSKLGEDFVQIPSQPVEQDTYLTSRIKFLEKKLASLHKKAKQLDRHEVIKTETVTSVGKLRITLYDGFQITLETSGKQPIILKAGPDFNSWEKALGYPQYPVARLALPLVLEVSNKNYSHKNFGLKGRYTVSESRFVRDDYGEELNSIAAALKECADLDKLVDDAIKAKTDEDTFGESFDWYDTLQKING